MIAADILKLIYPRVKVDLGQTSIRKGYKMDYKAKGVDKGSYEKVKSHNKYSCARCTHEIDVEEKVHLKETEKKDLGIFKSSP